LVIRRSGLGSRAGAERCSAGTSIAAALLAAEVPATSTFLYPQGSMELVVPNVGLDMGVLSPTLFTMLVIMALVTTFSTTPVLNLFMRKDRSLGPAK
jgi:Kef-type K+ transport system membrane component KefB